MKLVVEPPNQPSFVLPWNTDSQEQFCLTREDIELLETGEIFWHGETALTLEE